jgi:penicillin-binding protein 1A
MQKTAAQEIEKGLRDLDKRQGYRGPLKNLAKEEIETFSNQIKEKLKEEPLEKNQIVQGVVIEINETKKEAVVKIGDNIGIIPNNRMAWARKPNPIIAHGSVKKPGEVLRIGDVIYVKIIEQQTGKNIWELALEQEPKVQSALLCLEAGNGHVKAMMGGRDFEQSQFNRAIQSRRQPGSAFKPVVYAAALDKGYTPASVILDTAIVYEDKEQNYVWKPKNYGQKFYGPTLFRDALAHSRNLVTIKILKDIGIDYTINYAKKLGITSALERDLSLALGSSGVSLLELVNAYSVFANTGYLVKPVFITKILDRRGNILEEAEPENEKVIEGSTAYLITSLLESAVKDGTGKTVRALNRPVAGKTGTTNDMNDAWFVGYTPQYITGTWVGFDDEASLGKGETGASAAAPIWLQFMSRILENEPVKVFQVPGDVIFARIDAETGLLPIAESKKTVFECFKQGTVPKKHTVEQNLKIEYDDFFKSGM